MHPQFHFEGPEKKLHVAFQPAHSPLSSPVLSERDDSDDEPDRLGLRSLSRQHIDTILRAASCTVISLHRNPFVDAYLLSESSLFVADTHLTIKTCGTTTLLPALSVLIKIAYECLAFTVSELHFSRVAYLFPHAQPFPHDSFQNEVAFLNAQLETTGHVFETPLHSSGSKWHLYLANLNPHRQLELPAMVLPAPASISTQQQHTLEINMFDLHPSVMSRFMFHSRPDLIGSQPAIQHTTRWSGIAALLNTDATVDAFNFQPCGYSMNALLDDAYYTIHITPESDASYVSFETTAEKHLFPQLISAVVKLFQPGHFVVSLIAKCVNEAHMASKLSWNIVSKLLQGQYLCEDDYSFSTRLGAHSALIASFRCTSTCTPISTHDTLSSVDSTVAQVGQRYSAEIMHMPSCTIAHKYGINLDHNANPTLLVDLSCIARNVKNIRHLFGAQCPTLRFSVKCNDDEAIISLLSKLDVHFELSTVSDVDLLHRLGVKPERILLVDTAFSLSGVQALDNVGTVSIFEPPPVELVEDLKGSEVKFEIRVQQGALSKLHAILKRMKKMSDRITSIAFEKDPNNVVVCSESGHCNTFGCFKLLDQVCDNFCRSGTKPMHVNIGDMWQRDAVEGLESLMENVTTFIPDWFDLKNISVDVSRLVVGNSVSLVTTVIGRRVRQKSGTVCDGKVVYSYYLDDGVYGAFGFLLDEDGENTILPAPFIFPTRETDRIGPFYTDTSHSGDGIATTRTEVSILFGPTCDATDRIWEGNLPLLNIGDRLVFPSMGAYASSAATSFNGCGNCFDTRYVMSARCCAE